MKKSNKPLLIPSVSTDNGENEYCAVDSAKRATLKIMGVTAGVAATVASATLSAAPVSGVETIRDTPIADSESAAHHLTINIQKNRDDIDDWVLIENMTEAPVLVRSFAQRYVRYDNTVLDLQALLSRQQKGKNQLEIWPNHAWSHSTRDATRTVHALRPVVFHTVAMNQHSRSVQINATVTAAGEVTFLS